MTRSPVSAMWFPALAMSLALSGCRRTPRTAAPVQLDSAATDGGDAGAPLVPCALSSVQWRLAPIDGGVSHQLEGAVSARTTEGDWFAWIDRRSASLIWSPPSGPSITESLGVGEVNAPVLVSYGRFPVLALVRQRGGERVHHVRVVRDRVVVELFQQRESVDDGMGLSAVATREGVLLAWDEEREGVPSEVRVQFVPNAQIAGTTPVAAREPMTLSAPAQDAVDPVVVSDPAGGAIALWLASQSVETAVANQSSAEIFARRLDARGVAVGPAERITPAPAIRFGITAMATPTGLWVAYRSAADADLETRGDGGTVALVKLDGALRPVGQPMVLSEPDGIPSGAPALLADGTGVSVFWVERDGESLRTMRRAVSAALRIGPVRTEPALQGALPIDGARASGRVLVHGPGGSPGIASLHCADDNG